MSTIANLPKVKEALDNLREVLETERRDRIEFLRSCIGSWKEEIARAEKLPEQIARSEAEIAGLETVSLPLSLTVLGGTVRNCPLCLLPVMTSELSNRLKKSPSDPGVCPQCQKKVPAKQLEPKPDDYAEEVDGKKVPVVLCDACREERSRDV